MINITLSPEPKALLSHFLDSPLKANDPPMPFEGVGGFGQICKIVQRLTVGTFRNCRLLHGELRVASISIPLAACSK